jgi:Rrf2 family iron-sulfur cluster assembly transcriptional regulator
MIRINRQTDYAIRVLLALADRPVDTRVSTSVIQSEMLIPPVLAQRIVATLAHNGFIVTYPGRDGGIQLARPPEQINLRQVVETFEGDISLSDCLSGDVACPFDRKCPVRCYWVSLQESLLNQMEKITFDQLAKDASAIELQVATGA